MASGEIARLRAKASELFYSRKYQEAYRYAKQLADQDDWEGLFKCGLILEYGWLDGKPDLPRAYEYFRRLSEVHCAAEGFLGCARIMVSEKRHEYADELLNYCEISEVGASKCAAYILGGRIYEELYIPPNYKMAKKKYLKAAYNGSILGLNKYARALWSSGNRLGSIAVHIFSVLARPIYFLIWGRKKRRAKRMLLK